MDTMWSSADDLPTEDPALVEFDEAFFPSGSSVKADLSRFVRRNPVLPGMYDVDLWLNDEWQARRSLRFVDPDDTGHAWPCIEGADLVAWGVVLDSTEARTTDACTELGERIPGADVRMDIAEQRLDLTVPQARMARVPRGAVPKERWDHGVNGARLSWRMNAHRFVSDRSWATSAFLGLESGVNLGAWRWRHAGVASPGGYRPSSTFIQRDIPALHAQWRLGDVVTRGDAFPSIRLRGMTLGSDARMAPESSIGFAPAIRGIAASHAQVTVRQRGTSIYTISVPPGPFVIDDLYATGSGDDIEVAIEERDGRLTTYKVPSTAMAGMLRKGAVDMTFGVGDAEAPSRRRTRLVQASWRRGVGDTITTIAGIVGTYRHREVLVGTAIGTRLGAVGLDIAHARTRSDTFARQGRLVRIRYVRRFGSDLNVVVRATQPWGAGYRSIADSLRDADARDTGRTIELAAQRSLDDGRGSLNLSSTLSFPRSTGARDVSFDLGWTASWQGATVGLNAQRAQTRFADRRRTEFRIQASLSVPLGGASSTHSLGASVDAVGNGRFGAGVHLSGTTGVNGDGGYLVSLGRGHDGTSRASVALSKTHASGEAGLIADADGRSRGLSVSASGGIVAHRGGVVFAPRLGDAVAVVSADGAAGATLASTPHGRLDRHGRGVAPQLVPYRWNNVDIDPSGLSLDVDIRATHRRIVPTAGAILEVRFETHRGRTTLVEGRRHDGTVLPFGAEVIDADDRSVGVVGQAGRVFVRTDRPLGDLRVRWGDATGETCRLRVPHAAAAPGEWLRRVEALCE